jgi:hypothetical protein
MRPVGHGKNVKIIKYDLENLNIIRGCEAKPVGHRKNLFSTNYEKIYAPHFEPFPTTL